MLEIVPQKGALGRLAVRSVQDVPPFRVRCSLPSFVPVQITPARPQALNLPALAERLGAVGAVTVNPYLLRLAVDGCEITLFADARAIIQGTTDESIARSLYAKYIGT